MGAASYGQTSFLGGEWSVFAQGRYDDPKYKTAVTLCLNGIPIEEGAWNRRSGFRFMAPANSSPARVIDFTIGGETPYALELSNGFARFYNGAGFVFQPDDHSVVNISTTTPAIITVGGPTTWATGDQVQLLFASTTNAADAATLRNRQFVITILPNTNGAQFSLVGMDDEQPVNGSLVNWDPSEASIAVAKIVRFATPYTTPAEWKAVNFTQGAQLGVNQSDILFLFNQGFAPVLFELVPNPLGPNFVTITNPHWQVLDGPYLDPVPGSTLTPSALFGTVTLTLGYQAWSSTVGYTVGSLVSFNGTTYQATDPLTIGAEPDISPDKWQVVSTGFAVGQSGFTGADIGRSIRLLSEPQVWQIGTNYATGNNVKFGGAYYQALSANSGAEPDTNLNIWQVSDSQTIFTWTWAIITSVMSAVEVAAAIVGTNSDTNQISNLLYTTPILTWQLGAYAGPTWPSCGIVYEGRLWLAGAITNRFDASESDNVFSFSPTASDGTVGDGNGITETLNSDDANDIQWLLEVSSGLVAGTVGGEWLIQASQLQDPITPSSIQAHRVTKYGSSQILPVKTPLTTVFVHKHQRSIYELFPDVFSQKVTAPPLNQYAKHLTSTNVAELAYQSELTPVVWARLAAPLPDTTSLIGATYRRISSFASEPPAFVGWHRHHHGMGRQFTSICSNLIPDGTIDTILATTLLNGKTWVESLTPLRDVNDPLYLSWYVDSASTPAGATLTPTGIVLYGYWYLNGQSVAAVIGGLDCGQFTVVNGSVTVPFLSDPGKLFTLAFLEQLSASGANFGSLATSLDQNVTVTPPVVTAPQIVAAFVPLDQEVVGNNNDGIAADFHNGHVFTFEAGGTSTSGVRVFSTASGLQTNEQSIANMGFGSIGSPGIIAPAVVGFDGNLYFPNASGNMPVIVQVNPTTLQVTGHFGAGSGSLFSSPQGLAFPNSMAPVQVGGKNYLVAATLDAANKIEVVDVTDMLYAAGSFVMDETTGLVVSGQSNLQNGFGQIGVAYTIGTTSGPLTSTHLYITTVNDTSNSFLEAEPAFFWDDATTWEPGQIVFFNGTDLYYICTAPNTNVEPNSGAPNWSAPTTYVNPGINTVIAGELTASQIDPAWLSFQVASFAYDQNDGNLVVTLNNVTTNPGALSNFYVAKIAAANAAVIWTTPIPAPYGTPGFGGNQDQITGGTYGWITTTSSGIAAFSLDTVSGHLSGPILEPGVSIAGGASQIFNSVTGQVISIGSFDGSTSGAPAPAAGTPSFFVSQWFSMTLGTFWQGFVRSSQRLSFPAVVGIPFTSSGQLLRPQTPQETGSQNGPALGKTRRNHMFGMLIGAMIYATTSIGTNLLGKLHQILPKSPGGTPTPTNTLYSGVYWSTIEDVYSFDGQICWTISRPLPLVIASVEGFINTQDR